MRNQLLNEICRELASLSASAPVLTSRAAVPKVYEIFVLACLMRALRNLGADLEAFDNTGRTTTILDFRLNPGLIYSPSSTPGFIFVRYNNNEYEIHNGLRVLGKSKVLHELDVCLIERDEAIRCRNNRKNPKQSKTKFLAECKYYGPNLRLSLGREFIGLARDFTVRITTIVSNVGNEEVHNLVTHHKTKENFQVTPLQPQNVERFVQWLANELRQIL